jgi:hypothetical protein
LLIELLELLNLEARYLVRVNVTQDGADLLEVSDFLLETNLIESDGANGFGLFATETLEFAVLLLELEDVVSNGTGVHGSRHCKFYKNNVFLLHLGV